MNSYPYQQQRTRGGMRGLSGAPLYKWDYRSVPEGWELWSDAEGLIVDAQGIPYTGYWDEGSKGLHQIINGYYEGGSVGTGTGTGTGSTGTGTGTGSTGIGGYSGTGASKNGTNANMPPKKCCDCTDTDNNEVWYLAETRRTPQDIPVRIVKRKITCSDPNSKVTLDCNGIKGRMGLQGLGSLNCGFDNRM